MSLLKPFIPKLLKYALPLGVLACFLLLCIPVSIARAVSEDSTDTVPLILTEEEKAWLAAHPVIKAPTTVNFEMAPIYLHDEMGVYTGIGVDIAEIVCKRLGIELQWVDYETQVSAIDALMNWKVDFISFMGEDMPGEGSRYQLSSFFHQFPTTLVVQKSVTGRVTVESLQGKRVAGVKYWPDTEYLKEAFPEIEVVEVKDVLEGLQKVAFGEVDACVAILPIAAYEIRAGGITTLRIGGKLERVFRQGFGIRSDWPVFVGLVNKALATMSEKEKADLYNKWVPVLVSDNVDFERLMSWLVPTMIVVAIIFGGVVYWNRKLAQANLAERKARKEAREKAEEALCAKRKMEKAVREEQALRKKQVRFVDMISHEYRTPVAVLQANLDIMQIKGDASANQLEGNIDKMQLAITRLTELLNTELHKDKNNDDIKASFHRFDLQGCLEEATDHVRSLWPDRIVTTSIGHAGRVDIDGDQQLIKTALLNLMENALKYSAVEAPVSVSLEAHSGEACIEVKDLGIGIPKADQERIFEKYFRADHGSEVSGTGVGLFLVRQAIKLHGGQIAINSSRNQGTTITVTLPTDHAQ